MYKYSVDPNVHTLLLCSHNVTWKPLQYSNLSVFDCVYNPFIYNCRKYGVFVHGVDLSPMMITKANEYLTNQEETVQKRYARLNQYKIILRGINKRSC